jgi:phage terminase large subunit-like protein
MVNPRIDCEVEPTLHASEQMRDRKLSTARLELLVREGRWVAESANLFVVTHKRWMAKVMVGVCNIRVVTAWRRGGP